MNAKEGRKVLEINWGIEHDVLSFNFEKILEFSRSLTPTKRNLHSMIASLYDPLGLISPLINRNEVFVSGSLCTEKV